MQRLILIAAAHLALAFSLTVAYAAPAAVTADTKVPPDVATVKLASRLVAAADDPLATPSHWFRAAAQHAAEIGVQAGAGGAPAKREQRLSLLTFIVQTQAEAGDAAGAVASARQFAPETLPSIARALAGKGDVAGAMATLMLCDDKQKPTAQHLIVDGLIWAGKLSEVAGVLKNRPGDELTAGLFQQLATAEAKAGDLAAAQEAIRGIVAAPAGDGLNDVRRAEACVALASAQAKAGDRAAYLKSLETARALTKGFRPPYESNTLVKIALAQAAAGDYEAAAKSLADRDPKDADHRADLVLAAQVRRGDVKPDEALTRASGSLGVPEAVVEVQLAAKDYKAAAKTLLAVKGLASYYSENTERIIDSFLDAADVVGAAAFVGMIIEPATRAKLYSHLATRCLEIDDRVGYQNFIEKAVASAAQTVEPPPMSSIAWSKSGLLGLLAQIQVSAGDFDGAKKTIAQILQPEIRHRLELEVQARELAARGRLEEAKTWAASLKEAEDRALACYYVALQLLPKPKPAVKAKPSAAAPAEVERLIKQLGADPFKEREAAQAALLEIGEPAMAALQAAAKDSDVERASRAKQLLAGMRWGVAVEDVQVGLVADKRQFALGEAPMLRERTRNLGKKPWIMTPDDKWAPPEPVSFVVIVDGVRYRSSRMLSFGSHVELKPGESLPEVTLHLDRAWMTDADTGQKRLSLLPGKHTVRVGRSPSSPMGRRSGPPEFEALSNPVEIEILPADAAPGKD
jgi:hypothetical protein